VDDVESLIKRHEYFENTLQAQEEKIKALNELADRLMREGHLGADR
jgi:spectrin beta